MAKHTIEIEKETLLTSLRKTIESERRAAKGAKPQFKILHEAEITELTNAINSIKDLK